MSGFKLTMMSHGQRGISLLEIVISMVILALVLVGLVNVFVLSKSYIMHSRNRISASELGKEFLDPLQAYVNQESWEAGNLLSQNGTPAGPTVTVGLIDFSSRYNITSGPDGTSLRKVTVNISWDEPQS